MQVTIDANAPYGYEFVGEYRWPQPGEPWLDSGGNVRVAENSLSSRNFNCLILRRSWVPPAYLPEGCWLFETADKWFISDVEPGIGNVADLDSARINAKEFAKLHGETFEPPPVTKLQVKRL